MGKDIVALLDGPACAAPVKPVPSTTNIPGSREESLELKYVRRNRASGTITEVLVPSAAFLIASHHHARYPTLFGSSVGHPPVG
jgi:hypothetical protein